MIIKKLKLQNIRSYKEAIIDFPLGRTLFEGNIGSGKSTILMAIEFGLFGLGSEKGGSLLRAGEDEGSVGINFECNGVDYIAIRGLKRNKKNAVQQGDRCKLQSPSGVEVYTPGELKEKIIEILGFNESLDPKAKSVIYRYAIYTPQEMMKDILAQKPDVRMQTLRKAFGIEDYKTAGEHATSLQREIKTQSKIVQRVSDTTEELKKTEENTKAIVATEQELVLLGRQESENNELLSDLKSKRDGANKSQLALSESVGRLAGLKEQLENRTEEANRATQQLASLAQKMASLEPQIKQLEDFQNPSPNTLKQIRDEITESEKKLRELVAQKATVQAKLTDYGSIVEEGVCPTCDRPAEASEFTGKIGEKRREFAAIEKENEECSRLVNELRDLFETKRLFENNQNTLGLHKRNLGEYKQNEAIWRTSLAEAESGVKEAEKQLVGVGVDLAELERVKKQLSEFESEIDKVQRQAKEIAARISSANTRIEGLRKEIQNLNEVIKKKQEKQAKAFKLGEYQVWVQDYFIPTLGTIEQQVMNRIREDFDAQFQKWFGMLLDDPGKEARIDEEFTPLIQQDGMDQDVDYLSGGEKTSVALAYRLALNNIVGKVAAGAKENLLILDEPTDGFSKEQLGKVREILDEIKNPQVILVSHETELESFADQVIKVSKRNGESVVSSNGV